MLYLFVVLWCTNGNFLSGNQTPIITFVFNLIKFHKYSTPDVKIIFVLTFIRSYEIDALSGPFHFCGTKTDQCAAVQNKNVDVKTPQVFKVFHGVFMKNHLLRKTRKNPVFNVFSWKTLVKSLFLLALGKPCFQIFFVGLLGTLVKTLCYCMFCRCFIGLVKTLCKTFWESFCFCWFFMFHGDFCKNSYENPRFCENLVFLAV